MNRNPLPLAQVKGWFMKMIQQAILPTCKNMKWSTVCYLGIGAESLILLPLQHLFGARWCPVSACLCRSTHPHMADTAVFYLPICPSFLTKRTSVWWGCSKPITTIYGPLPSLLYTSQWPYIFRQMRLKEKTAGNSGKALTFPDKGQRHCLVPPSFFFLLVVIARAAASIMGPWEKGQKNHKVVFHPWTSLSAWTNIVQQVNITCKITKPKTNKQTTTTKKNLHPLAFKPLWVINRLLLLASESFPGGSAGKEFTCNAGDLGLIPGLGRSPGEGKGYPLQYFGRENSMDYPWGHKELDTTEWLSLHFHLRALFFFCHIFGASLVAQTVKRLPTMREIRIQSLGWEDPLEKEMATHSSTLAWKIPWMEEPSRV